MIFRDIIKLVVPQNERKAKKEDTAVLKTLATAFFKDQTLLTDTAYYLYEKGNYQNYLSEKEDSNKSDKDDKARDEESKRRLLNGLLAYPVFSLAIYNSLLAPDDDPNIKLQVAAEKDMKEVKVELNRINLLEKFLAIDNFRSGIQTLNEDSDSILHLIVRKDRPHAKILAILLSHLSDIVNLPNSKGNTPYLDSVNYKKHWAISCFNLSTANITKDAKNLQGEDARALAGYDESVQQLISRIQLEPIGILSVNKKFGAGAFYDSYPAFFLSGRNHLSASTSTSSNSITGSSSSSFSSSSSSLLSSPLNSNRSYDQDSNLPSARSDMSVESSPDVLQEEPEQVKERISWMRKDSVTVYQEFKHLLQTDKAAINKSLKALFAYADLKDKKTLLTDLFALFEQEQAAVEYFNELRQHAQKKYDELQCLNNDFLSKMMFRLVMQLKANDPIRRLTPFAIHLMAKQLSGTKNEIAREIHLREALFILTSKGNRSKNWQTEFDVILFRVTGLQALYSQREILAALNSLYSKFDSRQIMAANLILFQLMIYNPSDFFKQEQLVKEAEIFINRGFEKDVKQSFERKRIRSILSKLIVANHQFYTHPLIEHFDSLNQWASRRESGNSFEQLVSDGIKQKDHLLRKSKVHSISERDSESKLEETTRLIAQEMRVSMVSFYKQVSLEGLYNYEPPKEEPSKKSKSLHPDSISVSRTINQFNVLNQFFLKKIFDNTEKLLSSLELLLSVGQQLCPLGDERYPDLNHLMVIRGVLSSLPVSRLTRHFQALSPTGVNLMKEMTSITDSAKGFAKMTSIANEYKTTLFFLGRITSQITFAKEVPRESSKGCDLYFMSEFPKSLAQYRNSYIFVKEKGIQELYYVKPDEYESEYETVRIDDFNLFEENINAIRNNKEVKIHLSEEQVKTIITLNGGHTPIKDNGYKLLEHCEANGKVLLPILKLKALIRFYSQMSNTDLRQAILEKPMVAVDDDEFYALSKKLQPASSVTESDITIETSVELSAFLDRLDEYLKLSHIPVIQSSGKRIDVSETSNFLINWFQEKIRSMEKELAQKQDNLTNFVEDSKALCSHLVRTLEKLRQVSRLYYRTSPAATLNFLDKRYNPIEQNNKIKKLLNAFITKTRDYSEASSTTSTVSSALNSVGTEASSNTDSPRENSGSETQRSKRSSGFFRMRLKKEGFVLPPAEDSDTFVFEQS